MDYYAEYHRNRHSIYKLQYHLVVVTKYRHPVITGGARQSADSDQSRSDRRRLEVPNSGDYY